MTDAQTHGPTQPPPCSRPVRPCLAAGWCSSVVRKLQSARTLVLYVGARHRAVFAGWVESPERAVGISARSASHCCLFIVGLELDRAACGTAQEYFRLGLAQVG